MPAKKIKGKDAKGQEVEVEIEAPETPEALTEEQLDAKFNAMMTARLSRFEATITKTVEGLVSKLAPAPAADSETKGKKAKDGESDAVDARLKALQDQLASERKAREDADKAREEAENRRKQGEKSRSLAAALADLGVSPSLREAAQALLETKGLVTLGEDGSVAFKSVDKYGNERMAPLKDGLSEWFKAEGAPFVPAKGAGGSGTPGPSRQSPSPRQQRQLTPEQAAQAKKDAAAKDLVLALHGLPPEAAD